MSREDSDDPANAGFRKLVERSPLGIYRTTHSGEHLFANRALLDLAGFESMEALTAFNLEKDHFPPSYSRAQFKDRLDQEGKIVGLESTWTRVDGTHVEVRETVQTVRDGSGQVLYFEGIVEDITQEKRARAEQRRIQLRYQRVVDHIGDALMMDDVHGNVVFANRAFLELFGLEESELDGLVLEDYVAPEWRPVLRDRHDRRVRGEDVPGVFEYVGVRRDQTRMDLEVSVVEVVEDGKMIGTQSVIRDLTERKALENRHAHAERMELLGQLAGGIAHDFNNVLTALLHYPPLIASSLPEGNLAHEYLEQVTKAVERAAGLTRQLLTFSRKQVIQPRRIDIDQTILAVLPMMRRVIGETITLRYHCAATTGSVLADPSQLEQVVVNLIVNARDAMPEGGSISIEVEPETLGATEADALGLEAGRHVVIRVTDDGTGMPDDVLSKVFVPFFTTKPAGKGTGLGLATVVAAIQRASGQISVASEVGRGTTFTIRLPMLEDESTSVAWVATTNEASVPFVQVLVVEDDPVPRMVLEATLKSLGHTVRSAPDGATGLAILADAHADIGLLISDLVMPQMSGPQFVRTALALRPGLPVLFVSGYAADDLPAEVEQLGIPFLEKPFTRASLADKLRELLCG